MPKCLIVGAGLAGAVHARELAERGHAVRVIDRRDHVAGNCFDHVLASGVRVHRYGPHLFHTSNERVIAWVKRFADWVPYHHKVLVRLADGRHVPLPVNLDTVNAIFGCALTTPEEVRRKLDEVSVPRDEVRNAEDQLYSTIGPTLTDIFFRPYTLKMWGTDLREMDAAVVRRIQIRTDRNDLYFPNDSFQALPVGGYTAFVSNILDHPGIDVAVSTEFDRSMLEQFDYCFNSMPIDHYYDFEFGELPYRSIRFHLDEVPLAEASPHVTINYSDAGPLTRETWWHNMPGHLLENRGVALRTTEEPCDYRDNNLERYYPVKTQDGRYDAIYRRYAEKAERDDRLEFIGRCGTYQYLDMHQVINQSLVSAHKWLVRA